MQEVFSNHSATRHVAVAQETERRLPNIETSLVMEKQHFLLGAGRKSGYAKWLTTVIVRDKAESPQPAPDRAT